MGSHEKQNQLIYSWFIYNFEVSGGIEPPYAVLQTAA